MSEVVVPYDSLCEPCRQAKDFINGRADYSAMVRLRMPVPCEDCVERWLAAGFHVATWAEGKP